MYKKKLEELTIKDSFMFGEVMSDPKICHHLLELILDKKILQVSVERERNVVYHSEFKSIRLDIRAVDENQNVYNVEMQVLNEDDLKKRSRYYHGQIDMELLHTGKSYSELPLCYVIFICDFDLFGEGLYRYTKDDGCKECSRVSMSNGNTTIFLNTLGTNKNDVSKELISFLNYVHADRKDSERDFDDEFVSILQQKVRSIKASREMEMKYMRLALELMKARKDGWIEGRAVGESAGKVAGKMESKIEDIVDILSELGTISDNLAGTIRMEQNLDVLKRWLRLAFRVDSIEEFVREM